MLPGSRRRALRPSVQTEPRATGRVDRLGNGFRRAGVRDRRTGSLSKCTSARGRSVSGPSARPRRSRSTHRSTRRPVSRGCPADRAARARGDRRSAGQREVGEVHLAAHQSPAGVRIGAAQDQRVQYGTVDPRRHESWRPPVKAPRRETCELTDRRCLLAPDDVKRPAGRLRQRRERENRVGDVIDGDDVKDGVAPVEPTENLCPQRKRGTTRTPALARPYKHNRESSALQSGRCRLGVARSPRRHRCDSERPRCWWSAKAATAQASPPPLCRRAVLGTGTGATHGDVAYASPRFCTPRAQPCSRRRAELSRQCGPAILVGTTEAGGSLAASGSPASTRPDAARSTVPGAPLAVVCAATR